MFVDLSKLQVLDLSQNFSVNSPAFARYEGPTVKWVKRIAFEGVNAQHISSTIHLSTHLDSPWHFHDPGPDVAGIPIETLFGPACVVDLEQFGVGDYDIYGSKHFEMWEKKTGIRIQEGDILIIHTGFHRYYNDVWTDSTCKEGGRPDLPRYFLNQPGPTREFVDWVLRRGIRWLAVDAMSTDHPFDTVVRDVRPDVAKTVEKHLGKPLDEIWPREDYQLTHTHLFPHGVFHVENLGGDIDKVVNQRVWVGCYPFRFKGGEAAWCRMAAYVPK